MIAMWQTKLLWKLAIVSFGLMGLTASADTVDPLVDRRDAQMWLKKIQSAAQKLNYSGIFIYQQANQVRASRITHVVDGKSELGKLEILDGKPREYIRRDEEVACYIPESRTVLIDKRYTPDFFPAIPMANSSDLADHYDLKKAGSGRVAGYDCQTIALEPKDNLRYGYRLWAEKNTGLLLRVQTVNERNTVVEQITFAQVAIGGFDKNSVRPSYANIGGWHVESTSTTQENLSGWSVKTVPPGFRKIHELKRLVPDNPVPNLAGNGVSAQHEISQMVFSDGLAAISVFIEPGSQSRIEGSMQQGAINIVGKRQGDFWLTVVGEVPSAAIRQVANSIEFKPK
ncbi:MAG: MucB/RseB C-terminal domain-containing protein [Burkholderiales bacterium]